LSWGVWSGRGRVGAVGGWGLGDGWGFSLGLGLGGVLSWTKSSKDLSLGADGKDLDDTGWLDSGGLCERWDAGAGDDSDLGGGGGDGLVNFDWSLSESKLKEAEEDGDEDSEESGGTHGDGLLFEWKDWFGLEGVVFGCLRKELVVSN